LEVEAKEAKARKKFAEAKDLVDQAINQAPPAEKNRLFLLKAEVLFDYGVNASRDYSKQQDRSAEAARNLKALEDQRNKEKQNVENLGSGQKAASLAAIETRYRAKVAAARAKQARAEEAKQRSELQSKAAFQELIRDCTEILKRAPAASVYYQRARAKQWLNPSDKTVLDDLHRSLRLNPAYQDALQWVDALVPDGTDDEKQYLQDNRQYLVRYFKSSPYTARTLLHEAKLAELDKHYGEALEDLQSAIDIDPANNSAYALRARIERTLGFNDIQVKRDLAEGYREAALIAKLRGANSDDLTGLEWRTRSELAKQPQDELRCDPDLTTCTVTKTMPINSEWIYSKIVDTVDSVDNAKFIVARINRGSDDGIVVGLHGAVWAQYSEENGHVRQVAKLGNSEVVSLEPHSALVRIQVEQPHGDGLVRESDMVQLSARTPAIQGRSALWTIAKYNVGFVDSARNIIFDYDTLYSNETPDLDAKLYGRMLQEIHQAAKTYANQAQPVEKGKFAKQPLAQVMANATMADLKDFIDYFAQYPGLIYGSTYVTEKLYAAWVGIGAPLK